MSGNETTRRVAVTVIVDADGADERDARNVAVLAVENALAAAGEVLTISSAPSGIERSARVHAVTDLATALREGVVQLAPAGGAR
jgi:hypothetical protein